MITVTSKIKTIFSEELIRYIAAVCDTQRIPSNSKKMVVLGNLLYTYGIDFEILGGATNRLALQIDGYAIKFAIDAQGYQDNLMEYCLSPELQPFATKSYETNGYIQVQECVEVMSKEQFRLYKTEIYKILDMLCQDYLLGDVGYLDKNRTNWGIRDGKPVILDYAYCHRATENLFACDACGSALTYDSVYDKLLCSDRVGCKKVYTYNERKIIQGDQVDIDMIKNGTHDSIKIGKDEVSRDIEMFEDRLIGDNYVIIDSPGDLYAYNKMKEEKEAMKFENDFDNENEMDKAFSALVDLISNPNDEEAKKILYAPVSEAEEETELIYTERYYDVVDRNRTHGIRHYKLPHPEDYMDGIFELEEPLNVEPEDDEDDDMDWEAAFAKMVDKVGSLPNKSDSYDEPEDVVESEPVVDSIKVSPEQVVININPKQKPEPVKEPYDTDVEVTTKPLEDVISEDTVNEINEQAPPLLDNVTPVTGLEDEQSEVIISGNEIVAPNKPTLEQATILLNGVPLEPGKEVLI